VSADRNLQSWIGSLIEEPDGLRKQCTFEEGRRSMNLDEGSCTVEPHVTDFLPHHITNVARTGSRIVRYSCDEGLW